jgi:hypothetical protein
MIRTHSFPCSLPKPQADALNGESGRIYTPTLIWHYRIHRRKGLWLFSAAAEKLGDSLAPTTLHAHSRDAAQQGFYQACKTTVACRKAGLDVKYRQPFGWVKAREIEWPFAPLKGDLWSFGSQRKA